ncbi:hypothetical protein KUCAC02_009412 [Chaenocephalus aceratus]|uniref:Uncharacterized protein n=1 Tax=Chaenocephalus aceratus TaxID=36190 RepID=A0ACB9WUZ3_CHAAC|nr:hypothetical protein KUCAC02_009412 [Chaenocephalus aceratus]
MAAATRWSVPIKRDPVLSLIAPVSGLQPLTWSQDHRLAVSTTSSVSLLELVCDVQSNKQELTLHRTSIPVPTEATKMRVGPSAEQAAAMEKFSTHPDPTIRQLFLADRAMNPSIGLHKGMKYASWSPLGCDSNGRCLLACLTLDHRLTIHNSYKRLEWKMLEDLTKKYSERLKQRGYSKKDNIPPQTSLLHFDELQRRFRMQTPLRMEWSSVYTTKQVQPDNTCENIEMVLLAVLMENGDVVLWKFVLPFLETSDVEFYDVVESGVNRPSDLAWWEYDGTDRRMSGLIVGSEECDEIAVENLKCVPMIHPIQKTSLQPHRLHSLPVVSLAISRHGVSVTPSIPTCGLVEFLSRDSNDRASEVLIGHIKNKMNKQSFSERCSLCQEVLPFSDHKQATCKNGHMWLRCVLSYQACQKLTFRRCLLLDTISRLPEPEDPEWIRKVLLGPCTLCDSPMI